MSDLATQIEENNKEMRHICQSIGYLNALSDVFKWWGDFKKEHGRDPDYSDYLKFHGKKLFE